jgi:hypothetical protein
MKLHLMSVIFICFLPLACKEQKMTDNSIFPPSPIMIPFMKGHITHIFPVLKENCIGLVCGEQWAIATIKNDDISLDIFPEKEYSIPVSRALPQKNPGFLYTRNTKGIDLLDLISKKEVASFIDVSKSIVINVPKSKIVDYEHSIAISVFEYFDSDRNDIYQFVKDDILNKKRLKEVPITDQADQFPVYFTPSYTIYRKNWKVKWCALDNDLNETKHPLIDLLNKDLTDSVFAVVNDNMFISEEQKHALILTYSKAVDKDMLYLATWYGEPKVIPIPVDSSMIASGRRLVKSPNCNMISPSGKWVYFATEGGDRMDDTHYLIYLDPSLPNGYLPPFKLPIDGEIDVASWMTTPEGLVLYKDNNLLYFDLSKFNVKEFLSK